MFSTYSWKGGIKFFSFSKNLNQQLSKEKFLVLKARLCYTLFKYFQFGVQFEHFRGNRHRMLCCVYFVRHKMWSTGSGLKSRFVIFRYKTKPKLQKVLYINTNGSADVDCVMCQVPSCCHLFTTQTVMYNSVFENRERACHRVVCIHFSLTSERDSNLSRAATPCKLPTAPYAHILWVLVSSMSSVFHCCWHILGS